jgi:hypothetical protein
MSLTKIAQILWSNKKTIVTVKSNKSKQIINFYNVLSSALFHSYNSILQYQVLASNFG